ncbi:carbon-phosphorus lyase complex subunit PhnI [Conexibacter sp. JD483]|uniref:carbon-phosphorus lyase complex subunit PhnI n=1 Tax=unclassified Conexibacter TaxID=2627773 RepID=UPI0027267261|nr:MULTISPECIES: carbon-phosphorus lyase complex subunit PhnI [unclassified Conexibacter]MDO8189047.1 carbon-phosphorus lyase complex subunit PhnI [Conexibacter sp. CPCC 205706]MDO8198512.1 carbon-phosphorus lyase complex subunit PhnI [Conexibacter sp. CPCC 205762]MDR9367598.1 carbon-phosphorus lyase complex subunit PhnI [Conexibacter sp. JD483]
MAYTAVRGGEQAIVAAERLERADAGERLSPAQLVAALPYAVDTVIAEAGLYAPELAALALAQARGDLPEAAFLLRAYRSTLPRVHQTPALDTGTVRVVRRISSTYKDVPGGQVLGATRDYTRRLLGSELADAEVAPDMELGAAPEHDGGGLPKVTDLLRESGLVSAPAATEEAEPYDITRHALRVPPPRSGRLQGLARGEAGALTALAYSSLRGYGATHPTLAEFRVGHLPVLVEHPHAGVAVEIGEIVCTEVETVQHDHGGGDQLELGYGFTLGRNERKAIAMAILDAAIEAGNARAEGPAAPAEDEEFVLFHVDGIEATGYVEHLKLPHYVSFQSSLDRLRAHTDQEEDR